MSKTVKIIVNILITLVVIAQLHFTTVPFKPDMTMIDMLKNIFMWVVPSIVLYLLWNYNLSDSVVQVVCTDNTKDPESKM